MALSSHTLRLHSNRPALAGAAVPNIPAQLQIGVGSGRRLQVGSGVRLSRSTAPAVGQARAVLAERLSQTARPEVPVEQKERPETWSKEQRELVESAIDLGNLDLTKEQRAEVVKQVRAGAQRGLFFVKNFGVDPELINQIRRVAPRFFEQPFEEKVKTTNNEKVSASTVGYRYKFSTEEDSSLWENPAFREAYRMVGDPEVGPRVNFWPEALPEFREVLDEYNRQVNVLVKFLGGLLSEGLGLPETFIHDKYEKLLHDVVLCSSPPQKLKEGQKACTSLSAHSDPNMFNIHMYDGNRGLQHFVGGKWLDIPAVLDMALVNVGDDFETISNGIYHSPFHRVLTGPATRLSMMTTCEIPGDVMLAPAAEVIDEQNPARYVTRRRGDRLERVVVNFRHSLKPDRTKDAIVIDPDQHVDKTKNVYLKDGEDYIGGSPLLDWDTTSNH